MSIPEPIFRTMLARKDLYIKHERKFKRIFGISMRGFMDFMTGFDIVKFDDWLKTRDGMSTADCLKERYGDEAHDLVKRLIKT